MEIQEQNKRIAFDTCVIRSMLENPNYASMVLTRLDLRGAMVHICATVALETRAQDVAVDLLVSMVKEQGADVVFGDITAQMEVDARAMVVRHAPLLHPPDNRILAYAKKNALVLFTRDQGLEAAAKREGVKAINPDKLCGTDGRPRSRYENTAAAHSRRPFLGRGSAGHAASAAAHSRRPPADRGAGASRKRRRRNLPRRAAPLRA